MTSRKHLNMTRAAFPMSRSWGHDFPFRTMTGCEVSVLRNRTKWLGDDDFPKSLSAYNNSMSDSMGFFASSSWLSWSFGSYGDGIRWDRSTSWTLSRTCSVF